MPTVAERSVTAPASRAGSVHDHGPAVGAGPLGDLLGITLISAAPARVVGSMPVAGNTQPFGMLHGGASCVLAESLASIGACLHFGAADDNGGAAVGTELSVSHHRPVAAGLVRGTAIAVHLGRGQASYEIAIEDDDGRRVCSARLTCVRARN
jgi:1,4-dihydroxy-2-naphthoyl-CoA hydrolase